MKLTFKTIEVEKLVKVKEKTVLLELSNEEAIVLKDLCGSIASNGEKSNHMYELYCNLNKILGNTKKLVSFDKMPTLKDI